jgi:hypothetical protein
MLATEHWRFSTRNFLSQIQKSGDRTVEATVGVIIRTYSGEHELQSVVHQAKRASMTGHASTLEGLMRKLKLAGSCALVNIFFVIVLTESGALSEQMANEVKSKVIRLGFPAMKPRALTPVQLTQMRGMATTKIHILSSNSARVQESIQKARPGAPRCSPEDMRIENFGERVWCHHAGNPTSTDNCQSCIRIYKQYTDQHLAEKYLINKICGGHNYMDYVLTDGGLKLIQQECPQCTHFLVTNGDNIYSKVCHERL